MSSRQYILTLSFHFTMLSLKRWRDLGVPSNSDSDAESLQWVASRRSSFRVNYKQQNISEHSRKWIFMIDLKLTLVLATHCTLPHQAAVLFPQGSFGLKKMDFQSTLSWAFQALWRECWRRRGNKMSDAAWNCPTWIFSTQSHIFCFRQIIFYNCNALFNG